MTLFFENESNINVLFDEKEIARKVIEEALDYKRCPFDTQINLLITDNKGIHIINKEFRGIDAMTDVLSFPTIVFEKACDFDGVENEDELFDLESGELLLGDIIISMERVLSQAEEYGHSVLREYSFLIAHSMLHLFGYDHMTAEDAKQMEIMQEEILNKLEITR